MDSGVQFVMTDGNWPKHKCGDGCDFSINVRDLSEEAELVFCVHRFILLIYPELNITNESRNRIVDVRQTCHPHVSSFLRYLYTRQIDVSITSAQCLHQLAFIFGVNKLMDEVGRVFTLLLPEDNSFQTQVSMYEYGVRTGDLVLQENVLQYLSWNCEFLISSPVWSTISFHMMDALLLRSDLVAKDEALLLEGLERWIQDKGDEISSEQQVSLLNHIRFLLIPVDKLYEMQFSSSVLHQNHEKLYLTGLLRGFQFNALPFSKIRNKMDNMSNDYLPRIYTADEFSVVINGTTINYPYYRYNYGQNNRIQTFSTPAHPSALYKEQKVQWQAQIFLSVQECSNYGVSCNSVPVARLYGYGNQNSYANTIRFSNRLILSCKNQNNVFHVQDFKNSMAVIPNNSSMGLPNPCPDDYSFRFVQNSASFGENIRFLLIPVDKLDEMQFSSSVLHQNHEKLYLTGLLRGFQFNALPFSKIRNKMYNISNDYLPRIYTANEWSLVINDTGMNYPPNYEYDEDEYDYSYGQNNRIQTISTPAHPSALYSRQKVQWQAQVFLTVQECSKYGVSCNSVPVARLLTEDNQNSYANTIRFSNRLILTCKNQNNVFHVQDFKNTMAVIPNNSSMSLSNPCPDDYSFRFVVRPEYI
ncbi:Galectin-3-binding protein A [Anabarilius grahami]|uniref:Galectin-3-binding protein A n=1 Tax=Anabarilius grahami TaxID=495550 RepID=A0A3N0XQI5_ANAGA|nr:Galectin-3-binding protein A [Anabarilius grahami]